MFTIEEAIEFHSKEMTSDELRAAFHWRLEQPYDGYMGMLPEHMTDEQKKTFLTARERVFSRNRFLNFEDKEIIAAIDSWCEFYRNEKHPMIVPDEISKDIQELGGLKYQSLLNKDELLNETLGEGAKRTFISIYNDNPFLAMDGLDWDEVTMCVTEHLHALIQARGKQRFVSYTDLGFISKNRNKETAIFKAIKESLNNKLDILCGTKHKMKVSRLKSALQKYTGINTEPFELIGKPGNSFYKARFKIKTLLPDENMFTSDSYSEDDLAG